ncbi:MAG: hypothetical protein PHC75_05285 [Burkholderiales bacterium]|nr:hypothetical protein [Burkholderiales bacterium]
MKKIVGFMVFVVPVFVFAKDIDAKNNDLISAGKTYNLIFDLDAKPSVYDASHGNGLNYVKNMIDTCNKYKAKCNIQVVIHYKSFPLVVKAGEISSKLLGKGVFYDYNKDINYIINNGASVITSKDGMNYYNINESQLLPGVKVADSATLYLASQVQKGYLLISD